MKKAVIIMLVVGLIAGAMLGTAEARKRKKKKPPVPVKVTREDTGTYQAPTLVIAGSCSQTDAIGCMPFITGDGEQYVSAVEVTDQTGTPVTASLQQDTNADGQEDVVLATFCGSLEEPVQFDANYTVDVWVENIPNPDNPCQAIATSGEVKITFSNMP